MKKVLFIAYYYPPLGGIGSQRSQKFARYLLDYQWQPIVLTPQQGSYMLDTSLDTGEAKGVRVVRTPTLDISSLLKRAMPRRQSASPSVTTSNAAPITAGVATHDDAGMVQLLRSFARTWLYIPDGQIGWFPYALRAGKSIFRSQQVDAIYSTSFPVTSHLVAYQLKLTTGKPWIADFRDLWSELHYSSYTSQLRKSLDQTMERRLLEKADALVTVSDTWAASLRKITGGRKRVEVIRNGFDSNDFTGLRFTPPVKWTITYVGLFYGAKQDPSAFLEALRHLIDGNQIPEDDIQFNIVGTPDPYVQNLIENYKLSNVTHFTGFVSHAEALTYSVNTSLLLLILHRERSNPGHVPGKLYEYLGARRSILAIVPSNFEVARIIQKTHSGRSIEATEVTRIADYLLDSYKAHKDGGSNNVGESDLSAYERRSETQQLATLLDEITAR